MFAEFPIRLHTFHFLISEEVSFNNLFDVAHEDALVMMKIEEEKLHSCWHRGRRDGKE